MLVEQVLGTDTLAALDRAAEQLRPGLTAAPAYPTLRCHLALLAVDGTSPLDLLRAVAGPDARELDTALDPAAVCDWRLHPDRSHSPAGPLPWLPAPDRPQRVIGTPVGVDRETGVLTTADARPATGARYTVITDLNPYRLELAKKLGVTLAVNIREKKLADVQKQLGMTEGFDVGLEMSGNDTAFREMLASMSHGAKIAMLGIPTAEMAIDWRTVIFNMLTIKGIYGREMYETWYKMAVMLQSGLDISPVITHRFGFRDFEKGFAAMRAGDCGKVVLTWSEG